MGGKRRERGGSLGNIEKMLKRKREMVEGEVFKVSRKTLRSPSKGKGSEGGDRRDDEEIERGNGGGYEGAKGIKDWSEDLRRMKEEVKEGIKEQRKELKRELKEVRSEFRKSDERWEREREDSRTRVRELEEKVGIIVI